MNIDLKWFIPLIAPFFLIEFSKLVWWYGGGEPERFSLEGVVIASTVFGLMAGSLAATIMGLEGVKWTVRIGKDKENTKLD